MIILQCVITAILEHTSSDCVHLNNHCINGIQEDLDRAMTGLYERPRTKGVDSSYSYG